MPVGGHTQDDVAQFFETTETEVIVKVVFPGYKVPIDNVGSLFKDEKTTPTAEIRAVDFEINWLSGFQRSGLRRLF